ncbi:MAG TPA: UDP-N-acetylglucosamine 2-epimerase (non-hydrolyzing) [Acidimicrobiales bacterium]|nr:UDP-N-acetylglucosamine 2-epimerase (non-hydrolyzing) [Acidimicrobiales bacterium]
MRRSPRVLVACGTRPEFVKLAPVVKALAACGLPVRTVATGQHYDLEMAGAFFEELGLRPDVRHELGGDEPARLGGLVAQAERELSEHAPDVVLLLGDTNTVPAYGLAARRRGLAVAHLEAGLRSFNERSMEETNRRVGAAAATLQLAPTELARQFLLAEGVPERAIEVVGNPVIDLLVEMGVTALPHHERAGVLVTAHRATNVDDPERLELLVGLVDSLAAELGPVVFPVHPRTADRLRSTGLLARLERPGIDLLPPVPYGEMLGLVRSARVVVTDSGGVQEEASFLGVPVVVLRTSTPRWEGVLLGTARLVGLDQAAALSAAAFFCEAREQERVAATPCPYGDGRTGERVARLLSDEEVLERIRPKEPALATGLPPAVSAVSARAGVVAP